MCSQCISVEPLLSTTLFPSSARCWFILKCSPWDCSLFWVYFFMSLMKLDVFCIRTVPALYFCCVLAWQSLHSQPSDCLSKFFLLNVDRVWWPRERNSFCHFTWNSECLHVLGITNENSWCANWENRWCACFIPAYFAFLIIKLKSK